MPEVGVYFDADHPDGTGWEPFLRDMVHHTLRAADWTQDCEVSMVLTGDARIRELNRTWRHIDAATDVLSFSMLEADGRWESGDGRGKAPILLGDIVISVETAARRARTRGIPLQAEMALLAAHGVLHLLGYDHQEAGPRRRMRAKEGEAIASAGLDPRLVHRVAP